VSAQLEQRARRDHRLAQGRTAPVPLRIVRVERDVPGAARDGDAGALGAGGQKETVPALRLDRDHGRADRDGPRSPALRPVQDLPKAEALPVEGAHGRLVRPRRPVVVERRAAEGLRVLRIGGCRQPGERRELRAPALAHHRHHVIRQHLAQVRPAQIKAPAEMARLLMKAMVSSLVFNRASRI